MAILNYTTCCLYPGGVFNACDQTEPAVSQFPVDTLIYEIYIVDRAGHESNRVLTDPVFLQCKVSSIYFIINFS